MKKKKLITLFLILTLAVLITACGNKDKQKDAELSNVSVEESEKEETKKDKTDKTENKSDEAESDSETESAEIPKDHIHSYVTTVVQATCTKDGYTLNKCDCGDEKKSDEVKATGHSYGGWETTKSATTKEKGKAERVCSVCGDVDSKELAKLPKNHEHSYTKKVVEATCTTEGYTAYTCSCGDSYTDNKTVKKDHEYISKVTAPTCSTEGYTTYTCNCGDSYIGDKTAKTSHSYTDKVVAATCTTEGYTKHTCSKCGSAYVDGKVSATGHSYSVTSDTATCTATGTKTETCGKCSNKKTSSSAAKGHDTITETVNATCISTGYTKVTCKTCKTVVSNTKIPATGNHNWVTKTLSTAAGEAFDAGLSEFAKYAGYSDHNVQTCENCKMIDLSTAKLKYSAYEAATTMLGYVNELRREVLGEGYDLVLDTTLLSLAEIRAEEIVSNFSHDTTTFTNAGENITAVGSNIKGTFEVWKKSTKGHYENMINKNYKYFGYALNIGDLSEDTGSYGVQLFWTQSGKDGYY